MKLTVWKWLTPNKRWIHKVGLTPDIVVTVPADTPPGDDPVLDKALEVLGGDRRLRPRRSSAPPDVRSPGSKDALRPAPSSATVSHERKEVMCSVRTQSLHHLAGDGRLVGHLLRVAAATGRRSFGTGVRAFPDLVPDHRR